MALLALFLITGCAQEKPAPLRLGTSLWPGYEPLFLADAQGYYADQPIHFIEYPSLSGSVRAMLNGSIEAAALTMDEVLMLQESKVPVKVVLITDFSDGGDALLAAPSIESVEQLKGMRVSLEISVLARYMLSRALQLHGLLLEDVTMFNASVTEQAELYQHGEADAFVSYEPTRTKLLNLGARELFSSREIPGEIVDVVVVREDYLSEHPEQVQALIDGWYQALDQLQHHTDASAEIISKRLKITSAEVLASFKGLRLPGREETAAMLGGTILQPAQHLMQAMQQQGLLQEPVDLQALFSDQFVAVREK
jgi:NitT/TauT family transport system substrate-binding protein